MSAEMAQHVELEIEDRIRAGMSPAEARRTALRDFGGAERWKEEARTARAVSGVDAVRQDFRYAWRTLVGAPAFTALAVLTLAVGIGASAAVFSVVDGMLLRPLSYPEPDRLVRLLGTHEGEVDRGTISSPNFYDWVESATSFESAALYDEYRPTLTTGGEPLKVEAASVGAAYFDVLGVRPAVGRLFVPEDDEPGSSRVVLSWGLWQEVFGGDRSVAGRVIDLNGYPYTVVGVARPMEDPGLGGASRVPRLWRSTPGYFLTNGRGAASFTAIARLKPGVTVAQAERELSAIQAGLAKEYPESNTGRGIRLVSLKDDLVGATRSVLLVLLGFVGLVLLVACANVANLLLFRAAGRSREMGLRSALGASRGRILRQLLAESLLLAGAGAVGGVLLAAAGTRGLTTLAAGRLPRIEAVGVDLRVLGFAALVAAVCAVLFGLLPALHTTRVDLRSAFTEGGRGATGSRLQGRVRSTIVALQVAVALVVMIGAGVLGRSLIRLSAVDPGMAADRTLVLRIDLPADPYSPFEDEGRTALLTFYRRLEQRLAGVPGVDAAGLTDLLPMSGSFNGNSFRIESQPEPAPGEFPNAESRAVSPGYFEAMLIPVLSGRGLRVSDDAGSDRVVVVSRAFVRRYLGGLDPLEESIRIFDPEEPPARIVGVVGDVTQFDLADEPEPVVYVSIPQAPGWMQGEPWIVLRTASDPASLVTSARAVIRELEPRAPIYAVQPMRDVVAATLAAPRFRTVLLLSFALIAFILAAVGVYGMVAYSVARRLPELGVRMAMGADAGRIHRLVLGQGLRPILVGAAIGLAGGLAATRVLAGFLYGIPATDPVTFVGAPLLLAGVGALAAWMPARRAARLAPNEVLRAE